MSFLKKKNNNKHDVLQGVYNALAKKAHNYIHTDCTLYDKNCSKHKKSHYIPAVILIILVMALILPAGVAMIKLIPNPKENKGQPAFIKETGEYFLSNFIDGNFTETKKDGAIHIIKNQTLTVSTTSTRKLIHVRKLFPKDINIELEFTPWSERVINTVLVVHDQYEIVIGNNDYRNITIQDKSTGKFIPENNTGLTTQEAVWGFKKGVKINLFVSQEYLEAEGRYRVNIDVSYLPDFEGSAQNHITGTYFFSPNNKYSGEDLSISVGLINPSKKDEIISTFNYFSVVKK